MDKYTEHLIKLEQLLRDAIVQSCEKREKINHCTALVRNISFHLVASESTTNRINQKIKIINNYDANVKKTRKTYLKKWLDVIKKFNIAYLAAIILASLMGTLSINTVWVILVAEALLVTITGLCHLGDYNEKMGYIKTIYRNNTIAKLDEELVLEKEKQRDLKEKISGYNSEITLLDAEKKELEKIILVIKACIENIKNARSEAYEKIFSVENINNIINGMYADGFEQGLIQEVPEEALALVRKKEGE